MEPYAYFSKWSRYTPLMQKGNWADLSDSRNLLLPNYLYLLDSAI